jgi:hypothetical protein
MEEKGYVQHYGEESFHPEAEKEMGDEVRRWLDLAQDGVQWRALAALNSRILLSHVKVLFN